MGCSRRGVRHMAVRSGAVPPRPLVDEGVGRCDGVSVFPLLRLPEGEGEGEGCGRQGGGAAAGGVDGLQVGEG